MKKIFPLLLLLFWVSTSAAAMKPVMKMRVGTPPSDILKKILTTNSKADQPTPLPNRAPYITWLADSDSRLEPTTILPAMANHIYAVRSLACQMVTAQGSVDYGVNILHTPILLITGNGDNEVIALLLSEPEALPAASRAELDHLLLPILQVINNKKTASQPLKKKVLAVVEKNIDLQVERAMQRYNNRIKADRLVVIGAVYDIDNHYGRGRNRLQIININGITHPRKMLRSSLVKAMPPSLLPAIGRNRQQGK